ncbi:MAG: hypothetical protein IIU14_07950 [Ruminococcus sp.]|nr:hypothetical protein [Ruminococcus sp.]
MKYPALVPRTICKTPVRVVIFGEGLSEDGEPVKAFEADLLCNYQDGAKTTLTDREKEVKISGSALFFGDICESLATFSDGEVTVFGVTRKIAKGSKARNPDGTVNYTRLDLI